MGSQTTELQKCKFKEDKCNTVMNLQVLQNAGKLSIGYTTGGLSSNA
jgi:hypothetical protein